MRTFIYTAVYLISVGWFTIENIAVRYDVFLLHHTWQFQFSCYVHSYVFRWNYNLKCVSNCLCSNCLPSTITYCIFYSAYLFFMSVPVFVSSITIVFYYFLYFIILLHILPPWFLTHPYRVSSIVLLNSFRGFDSPWQRLPAIYPGMEMVSCLTLCHCLYVEVHNLWGPYFLKCLSLYFFNI